MLVRLIDHLKTQAVTAIFTSLSAGGAEQADAMSGVSSLMDAWVLVSLEQSGGARQRQIGVLKSRGMPHSNRVYEFTMTERGIQVPASHAAALESVGR